MPQEFGAIRIAWADRCGWFYPATRVHTCVLAGGGNLYAPDEYWDKSKPMCQGLPYRSLQFFGDLPAAIYALHAARGPTLIYNGTADSVVNMPKTEEPFFTDLQQRTGRLHESSRGVFEFAFVEGVSHRPFFVTRPAAIWLKKQLDFPRWSETDIRSLPETSIRDHRRLGRTPWHRDGQAYATEEREGHACSMMYPDSSMTTWPFSAKQSGSAAARSSFWKTAWKLYANSDAKPNYAKFCVIFSLVHIPRNVSRR